MEFQIRFTGHPNILSLHKKTIEITRAGHLTPRGDCIIGVNASCGCAGIPKQIKARLRDPHSEIQFLIRVGNNESVVCGRGHPDLVLSDDDDIVLRKSCFVCPRTAAIRCDKASDQLPQEMVTALQDPQARGTFTIRV